MGVPVTNKAVNTLMELSESSNNSINKEFKISENVSLRISDEQKAITYDFISSIDIDTFVDKK